jgi:hypothetical protein
MPLETHVNCPIFLTDFNLNWNSAEWKSVQPFSRTYMRMDRETNRSRRGKTNGQMFTVHHCKQATYDYVRVSVLQPLDRGRGPHTPAPNFVPDCMTSHLRTQKSSCFYVLNITTADVVRNLQNIPFEINYRIWGSVLWDIILCSSLKVNRLFGETYCLHHQGWRLSQTRRWLKMEAICSPETSADFQQTTRRHIAEHRTLS